MTVKPPMTNWRVSLKPQGMIPLFREVDQDQVIIIVNEPPERKIGSIWVNILLFALTVLSVMFTVCPIRGYGDD